MESFAVAHSGSLSHIHTLAFSPSAVASPDRNRSILCALMTLVAADTLGLPTLWVPHSYAACAQHAPNEHMLGSVAREGLALMAGLFWDLGAEGPGVMERRRLRAEA